VTFATGRYQLDQPFDEDRGLAGPCPGIDEHVAVTLPNSRVALLLIGRRLFLGLSHLSGVLHWANFKAANFATAPLPSLSKRVARL